MSKKIKLAPLSPTPIKKDYQRELLSLQIELVKLQKQLIAHDERILVILEGRDSSGKDSSIKRITEHLSPRETRVVALGKSSNRECTEWYFQRYVPHLPAAQELVLFNRSWYNRAGVEKVMGFCTEKECEAFLETVPAFEEMLVRDGIHLFKYYLDISKHKQKKRLESRRKNPLKQWKMSPIDAQAQKYWHDYSVARNEMFARTHSPLAPWIVVRADDKKLTRLNLIKHLLTQLDYVDKHHSLILPNPKIIFEYNETYLGNGMITS